MSLPISTISTSRRRFLKAGTFAAAAVALRDSGFVAHAAMQGAAATATDARIEIMPNEVIGTIAPEIYSHFIEHLGGVIYDGVWVGEDSRIPNINGIRKDFIDTMRAVAAPVLRWPGGCFADSYDWRDGIGPRSKRPKRAAFWWQQDTNAFGTHEFMAACKAIGCEPYLAADVRSLPARDFYQWVEYCNAPAGTGNALAELRGANGDPAPFNVRYWGVGNESWGCGGNQTPEEYAGEYRRYTTWIPNFGPLPSSNTTNEQSLRLIVCGPNGDDVAWTRGLMPALHDSKPYGLSTHYYTSGDAKKFAAGDALAFTNDEHYDLLTRGSFMENVIKDHWAILGETDTKHHTKLIVDEWGAWYGRGTELGPQYLISQQSTMRDALLSGITLDIFHRHAEKVAMANVAQAVNCIHSLMLAREDKFCVTPTFHVFKMYMPHRGGTSVKTEFTAAPIRNPLAVPISPVGGNSTAGSIKPDANLAGLSGSASISSTGNGKLLTLSVVNPHLDRPLTTEVAIRGLSIASATGMVLAEPDIHAHNDFAHPDAVKPTAATIGQIQSGKLFHTFPAASVTTLQITLA
jgi:alpha-N-arabinofuranosidase